MTFKDLRNKLLKVQVFSDNRLDILTNKPFWIWSKEEHLHEFKLTNGYCCFNHIIKCPTKDGVEYPLTPGHEIAGIVVV